MKIEKFKVLLYLKKSGTDKSGKAPIMGRITVKHDGAVRLQAVVQAGVVERKGKPSGRQESRGGGNQCETGQAAACSQCGI